MQSIGQMMRLKLKLTANSAEPAVSYDEVPKVLSLCHIVLCAMSLLLQQTMVRPAAIARLPMKRESGPLHLTMVLVGRRLSDRRVVFCNLGHGRTLM